MSRPDTKALRQLAATVSMVESSRLVQLCERVEALEAVLRNARLVALVAVEGITRPKVRSITDFAAIAGRLNDGVIAIDAALEGAEP